MIIAKYITSSGEIDGILNVPDEPTADLNMSEGYSWVLWPYDAEDVGTYKVDVSVSPNVLASKTTQSITATPSSITANGTDKSVLTGIASGSSASITKEDGSRLVAIISSGKMNFVTDSTGGNDIVITHPVYLDTTVTVTGT